MAVCAYKMKLWLPCLVLHKAAAQAFFKFFSGTCRVLVLLSMSLSSLACSRYDDIISAEGGLSVACYAIEKCSLKTTDINKDRKVKIVCLMRLFFLTERLKMRP